MITVEFLWVSGLGDCSASDTTTVHLPPVPLSCDTGRDLENELQGPSGVVWIPLILKLLVVAAMLHTKGQNFVFNFFWIWCYKMG